MKEDDIEEETEKDGKTNNDLPNKGVQETEERRLVSNALKASIRVGSVRSTKRPINFFGKADEDIWGVKRLRKRPKQSHDTSNKRIPTSLRRLMGEATACYIDREYKEAKDKCEEIIKKNANIPDPFHILGLIHLEIGERRRALKFLSLAAALEVAKHDYQLWMEVGTLAEELGDDQTALEAYETASTRSNRGLEVFERRSVVALRLGDYKRSAEGYKLLIDNSDECNLIHVMSLATCYQKIDPDSRKIFDLIKTYSVNVMFQPNHAGINYRSDEAAESKEQDEAFAIEEERKQFEAGLSLFSIYVSSLIKKAAYKRCMGCVRLFGMFLRSGEHGGTMRWKYFQRYKQETLPLDIAVKYAVCGLMTNAESVKDLIEQFDSGKDQINVEQREELNSLLGQAYAEKGNWNVAFRYLSKVSIQRNLYYQAICNDMLGNLEPAIAMYKQLLKVEGQNIDYSLLKPDTILDKRDVSRRLCELLLLVGKEQEARELALPTEDYFARLQCEKRSQEKDSWNMRKQIPMLKSRKRSKVPRAYTKAKKLRPETEVTLVHLNDAYNRSDRDVVLSLGLTLLAPYFQNGVVVSSQFRKLTQEFPLCEGVQTYIVDDEAATVASKLCTHLAKFRPTQALELARELYEGNACGRRSLSPGSTAHHRVFCIYIHLSLFNKELDDLYRKVLKHLHHVDDWDAIKPLWYLLGTLSEVADMKNNQRVLDRLVKRAASISKQSVGLLTLFGHHYTDTDNPVRAIGEYFQANMLSPRNPYILLHISITYFRLVGIKANTKRNECLMKGMALYNQYKKVILDAEVETEEYQIRVLETKYNLGLIMHRLGLSTYAVACYLSILENPGIPANFKRECAYSLSRIMMLIGNQQLAQKILQQYLTV